MARSRPKVLLAAAFLLALALWLARGRKDSTGSLVSAQREAPGHKELSHATASAEPEGPKKKIGIDEFLSRNDLCAVYRQEVHFDEHELIDRVLKAPDQYAHASAKDQAYARVIDALFSPDRDRALEKLSGEDESEPAVLFYRGLLKGVSSK